MSARHALVSALALWGLAACTMVASFPNAHAENDAVRCQNGLDDDLNGRLDCAELSCAGFCPVADAVRPASLVPCFQSGSLAFVPQTGDLTQDARCLPWAPTAVGAVEQPECEEGEVIFAGERSCDSIGATCPDEGSWPTGLSETAIYVRSGAATAGDGSASDPFTTLAQALAVARDGDTVVVGEGLYVETVDIDLAITLQGVCADQVHIWSEVEDGVVRLSNSGARIQDVTIGVGVGTTRAPVQTAIQVRAAGPSLSSVILDGVDVIGLDVLDGASIVGDRVVIRNLRSTTSIAVDVRTGGAAELHAFSAQDLGGDAIVTDGDLVLDAAYVDHAAGVALRGLDGAQIEVSGFASTRTLGGAIDIDCGSRTDTCAVVEDAFLHAEGATGVMLRGGSMELSRALVQRAEGEGVHVLAGTLAVEDLVVTGGRSGSTPGAALRVEAGGTLRGSRVLLRQNLLYGIELLGGALQLSDLMVDGRVPSGTSAVGIRMVGGAAAIQGFSVSQAGICGIELVDVDNAVLREGVVSESPRGVCVRGGSQTAGQLMSFIKFTADVQRPVFVETD